MLTSIAVTRVITSASVLWHKNDFAGYCLSFGQLKWPMNWSLDYTLKELGQSPSTFYLF